MSNIILLQVQGSEVNHDSDLRLLLETKEKKQLPSSVACEATPIGWLWGDGKEKWLHIHSRRK